MVVLNVEQCVAFMVVLCRSTLWCTVAGLRWQHYGTLMVLHRLQHKSTAFCAEFSCRGQGAGGCACSMRAWLRANLASFCSAWHPTTIRTVQYRSSGQSTLTAEAATVSLHSSHFFSPWSIVAANRCLPASTCDRMACHGIACVMEWSGRMI